MATLTVVSMALAESRDAELVAANLHAAPASRPALADVQEEENAVRILTLANSSQILRGEQLRKRESNRSRQIFRFGDGPVLFQLKRSLRSR